MKDDFAVVPAERAHYDEFLRIYNEGFLSKFRFISRREDLQSSFADDFGLIDLEADGDVFVAVSAEEVLGILTLHSSLNKKAPEKPNLESRELMKKYGFTGVLKAIIMGIAFDYTPPEGELYIDSIGVSKDARGQGVGTLLLDYTEELAREKGFETISLNVMYENPRAKELYERRGFSVKSSSSLGWFRKASGYSGSYFMIRTL